MSAIPVVLDVDTGTDDALAIAYAVQSPKLELLAVTTVAGNVGITRATANSLAVLDWLGATEVPVHRGASRPLTRPHLDASHFHHEGGLGGAQIPESKRAPGPDRGPAALIRLANARPGEITLVALGPLTNVAIALNVEPRLPELLKAVVLMGGAFRVPGNTWPDGTFAGPGKEKPAAEFNIIADPEAAAQVFSAPFKSLTAVGLDVTNEVALSTEDWEAVNSGADLRPAAALLREVGRHAFTALAKERFALHDPLAAAVTADSGLVRTETNAVTVDVTGPDIGRTRIAGSGAVQVAVAVNTSRALHEFRETLGLPTPKS